jgi:hypothetical protein
LCLISTKDQTERRRLYVLFFFLHVSLLLNIVSYQVMRWYFCSGSVQSWSEITRFFFPL